MFTVKKNGSELEVLYTPTHVHYIADPSADTQRLDFIERYCMLLLLQLKKPFLNLKIHRIMMLQATVNKPHANICVQQYKRIGNSANALCVNCRHIYFTNVCMYTEHL